MGKDDIPDVSDPSGAASHLGARARGKSIATVPHHLAERTKAETILRESGERYRQLIDVAPVAIFVHSDWRIVLVNPAMVRLFGAQSIEQLIGREVLDLIAPGSRELVRERIRQLYETPQSVPLVEVEYARLDGTQFSVEATAVSFSYAGRLAAQVVARDITSRKAAERALRESEQRFRALTELSSDWYWEQDENFRFVHYSPEVQAKAGFRVGTHLGKTRWELPAVGVSPAKWAEHRAALEAHQPFHDFEYQFVNEQGDVIWASVSGVPIFDTHERFAGYRGVGRNITARKVFEGALRDSEARKGAILDASIDAVVTMDHAGCIVEFNAAAERQFGYSREHATGKEMAELIIPPELRDAHRKGLARFVSTRKGPVIGKRIEVPALRADGSRFDVELAIVHIAGSEPPLFTGTARDITARKAAERLLGVEHAVTHCLAGAETPSAALEGMMRAVCESQNWETGRYFHHDETVGVMRLQEAWCEGSETMRRFNDASRGLTFAPGIGLVGHAWQTGKPLWVADVTSDPRTSQVALAREAGVRGALVIPVIFEGRTIGVLAISSRTVRQPDDQLLQALQGIASQLGQFLQRKHAEAALRQSMHVLESTFECMDQGVSIVDADLRAAGMNRRFRELLDFPESLCRPDTSFEAFIRYNAERGDYGPGDVEEQVRKRVEIARRFEPHRFERDRPDGTILEIRGTPMPGGGFVTIYTDVTERARAERALRESEARFRSLTELSSDWYWEQDEQFRFTRIAGPRASASSSRGDPSIYLGKARWEIADTEPMGGDWAAHRAQLERHEPFRDVVFRRRMADGTIRYLSISGEPVFGRDGRFAAYRGIGSDITERTRAEEALRASEERFRSLTTLSSDFYWETDDQHRMSALEYGPNHRPLHPKAHLLGKRRWDVDSTVPDEDNWRLHRATLDARLPFRDFEFARARKDGTTFYYSISGEPLFDGTGRFAGYRGVGREIGERKRAEIAILQSSEKYEGLVSSIDGIVWEADPATFTFHFVSDQAERLLGYPSRQWLEPNFWRDHTHPGDVAWAGEYCARSTAEKRNHEFEYRMIAADGRTVWLRDLVAVVVEDGVVVKLRGIMVDVTDRRRAELALRKSEERFRALTALSSDFYWETDRQHRFVMMEYGESFRGPMPSNEYAGRIRWEIPSVAPSEEGWRAHRETVDAHRPVRGFGFARRVPGGEIRHYEIDGDPLFDPGGAFLGYRGVGRDVTERLRAERALRDSERRVRALLRRLTATQEAERRRIAADLHDFVGQNLTALGIGLETLRGATPADAERRHASTFHELRTLLKDTMDTVRQTMSDLRPPLLDDYGLLAALESHGRQFSLRTGLAVAVQGQRIGARPAPNVELALFRIAQEALANAVKHAGASRAAVALSCKGGFLRLSIEDDGSGFAQPSGARAALQGGWGLPMMRERAEEAGGTLRIEFPARGTRVVAEVPHVDSNHPG